MAKKKTPPAAEPAVDATTPSDPALVELERLWQAGNYVGARRLARSIAADASAPAPRRERASTLLGMMAVDRAPLGVFVGMLLVLALVFINAIVVRNRALQEAPPRMELDKQLVPPPEAVPAEGSGDGAR